HLLLADAGHYSVEEEHLAQAITDSAADPGPRAQALAKRAMLLGVGRVERISEAEDIAGEALAAARSAGPGAERRARGGAGRGAGGGAGRRAAGAGRAGLGAGAARPHD